MSLRPNRKTHKSKVIKSEWHTVKNVGMSLVEDTRRSIWHAFTALAKGEEGQVAKSSLKVLTNNIGNAWGNNKAEEVFGDDDKDTFTFSDYTHIMLNKVLFPRNSESVHVPNTCEKIDKICWMLCETNYTRDSRLHQVSSLNSDDLFSLWKIFNFLAKVDLDSTGDKLIKAILPIRVDVEEAHRIGSLIRQAVGFDARDVLAVDPTGPEDKEDMFGLDFVQFAVKVIEVIGDLKDDVWRQGIHTVQEEILNDVIKVGYMEKYGNQLTTWKRRWFRLSAREMQYFSSDLENDLKGTIEVCQSFKAESLLQRSGHKPFCIKLHTTTKSFVLAAADLRSKNEWLVALQKASEHAGKDAGFQKSELFARERTRRNRRNKVSEELSGRSKMLQELQSRDKQLEHELSERQRDKSLLEKREQELEAERLARMDTEARLAMEEAALEAERERLRELEEIRAVLERLLEEERQAKRDEEIVRNLQSRLLLEETEKREQLEMLRNEQEKLLQQEREEKEGLEQQRQKQQELLDLAQQQLNTLAEERQRADQQIRDVEEKMQQAEHERQKMQERLRLREMSTSVGMRRPKPLPDPDPFVTHRGKGAFVEADFVKKNGDEAVVSADEEQEEKQEEQQEEQ